jgi:pentose-5-phosphate-3-epimerase
MNNEAQFETTAIIDIDAELKEQEKQKELLNTIKMEPILEKTVMEEETPVTKKKKMMEITDYILLSLIVAFIIIFVLVLFKLK